MFWFKAQHPETGEPLEVEAVYFRKKPGLKDLYGVPLEPDDPEMVVVYAARDASGKAVDFQAFRDTLEAAAWRFLDRF